MKISFQRQQLQLAHPWKIARTTRTSVAEVVILKLEDSDGVIGWGEASPVNRYAETPDTVENFLSRIDLDSLSSDRLQESLGYIEDLNSGNSAAKCAINTALVDIAAQRTGQSVSSFLGFGFRENAHLTSFTIGIDSPDVIESKVIAAEDYPILKIKVGSAEDKANFVALRSAAPHKKIRVDANEAWTTKEEALENIEWLASDGNVEFVEQPLPASASRRDWIWLKKRSPLPIFADESFHSAADAASIAERFHGVNVKLCKSCGVYAGYVALQEAKKRGLKTMIGCMIESSVLISAAAHLAELCDYLDLDGNLLITNDPFRGVTVEKGILSFANAPTATGLQIAIRETQ
jgi:L-Ala-D/L-Glu epimerase